MECYKCSTPTKKVYMYSFYEESTAANIMKCPCCGREEVIGFGRI